MGLLLTCLAAGGHAPLFDWIGLALSGEFTHLAELTRPGLALAVLIAVPARIGLYFNGRWPAFKGALL